ncbi:MAG: Crp/Fnr family transcriptional regulator [Bacteroidia bacterium]|nr:Crp/Fnr family transcriptional regulator [Bacteroidia bacterium]
MNLPGFDAEILEKRFPYFEPGLRQAISREGRITELNEGDEMIREGQYIKSFPLLLEGVVRVCRMDTEGRELLLYYLNPGEVCAMALTCCMGHTKSNIRAVTESKVTQVQIPVPCLDLWMVQFQSWKEFIMYAYRKRFDELLETIDGIAFKNMDDRLIKFFADRYRTTGSTIYSGTHQEIALLMTTSREVVSRLLKKLEHDRKIIISRNKIDFTSLIS